MKTFFLLVIWAQLGGAPSGTEGWVVIGKFATPDLCNTAGTALQTRKFSGRSPVVNPFHCFDTGEPVQ